MPFFRQWQKRFGQQLEFFNQNCFFAPLGFKKSAGNFGKIADIKRINEKIVIFFADLVFLKIGLDFAGLVLQINKSGSAVQADGAQAADNGYLAFPARVSQRRHAFGRGWSAFGGNLLKLPDYFAHKVSPFGFFGIRINSRFSDFCQPLKAGFMLAGKVVIFHHIEIIIPKNRLIDKLITYLTIHLPFGKSLPEYLKKYFNQLKRWRRAVLENNDQKMLTSAESRW